MTSEELQNIMNQCIGTEHYYPTMIKGLYFTDGVATFCKYANAYWLLTTVVAYLLEVPENDFYAVKLKVADEKAVLSITDGNYKTYKEVKIPYTDCPAGDWIFFVETNGDGSKVLLYCQEH